MTLPKNKRRLLLPIAAVGLAIVLPLHVLQLAEGWQAVAAERPAETAAIQPQLPRQATPGAAKPATVPVPAAPRTPTPIACRPAFATVDDLAGQADADLIAQVSRRTAELNQREKALKLREIQLAAASELASRQMAQLARMRQAVEALVVHETKASAADMKLLIGLYSNMKPAQAGVVLGKLDPVKAAEILQNLSSRMAGPILAAMDPAAAVKVTEELEQRHAAFRQ